MSQSSGWGRSFGGKRNLCHDDDDDDDERGCEPFEDGMVLVEIDGILLVLISGGLVYAD